MKIILENWNSYKKEIILEEKILNELKQLERIDEISIQQIAKKIGVPAAKVMLMAKLMAPAMASADNPQTFSDMFEKSLEISSKGQTAEDTAQAQKFASALVSNISAWFLPLKGNGETINIAFSIDPQLQKDKNISTETFSKAFSQGITQQIKARGYKVGKISYEKNDVKPDSTTPNTIMVKLIYGPNKSDVGYSVDGSLFGSKDVDFASFSTNKQKSFQDKFYDRVAAGKQGSLTGMLGGGDK